MAHHSLEHSLLDEAVIYGVESKEKHLGSIAQELLFPQTWLNRKTEMSDSKEEECFAFGREQGCLGLPTDRLDRKVHPLVRHQW